MTRHDARPGRSGEQGQAIVELALTLPLLLLVVLGVFDFGLMFQRYEVVTNAAREGARVAVLPGYVASDAQYRSDSYLLAGGLAGTPVHSPAGCTHSVSAGVLCTSAETVTETIPSTGLSPPKTIVVVRMTVTYDHAHVFVGPIMSLFSGSLGITRLRAVSTMRKEDS